MIGNIGKLLAVIRWGDELPGIDSGKSLDTRADQSIHAGMEKNLILAFGTGVVLFCGSFVMRLLQVAVNAPFAH